MVPGGLEVRRDLDLEARAELSLELPVAVDGEEDDSGRVGGRRVLGDDLRKEEERARAAWTGSWSAVQSASVTVVADFTYWPPTRSPALGRKSPSPEYRAVTR